MITNFNILNENSLYKCDKSISDLLLHNGFSLFSIDRLSVDNKPYIYRKTKELICFLDLGGEKD